MTSGTLPLAPSTATPPPAKPAATPYEEIIVRYECGPTHVHYVRCPYCAREFEIELNAKKVWFVQEGRLACFIASRCGFQGWLGVLSRQARQAFVSLTCWANAGPGCEIGKAPGHERPAQRFAHSAGAANKGHLSGSRPEPPPTSVAGTCVKQLSRQPYLRGTSPCRH